MEEKRREHAFKLDSFKKCEVDLRIKREPGEGAAKRKDPNRTDFRLGQTP